MQIAQIKDDTIVAVQSIMRKQIYDGGRWWDLQDNNVLKEWADTYGWVQVKQTPKPDDTDTTVYDNKTIKLIDGVPTEVWTGRPYTQEELDNQSRQANADAIQTKADAALANNKTFLAIASPTNAQSVAQVKALTRQMNALIRYTLNRLDSVEGT